MIVVISPLLGLHPPEFDISDYDSNSILVNVTSQNDLTDPTLSYEVPSFPSSPFDDSSPALLVID
jgi:hypothetical protein